MAIKTFTTGEVLTAADTNTYLANSGLVFVKGVTVGTGVSTIDITSCFNSTYDNYKISFNAIGVTGGLSVNLFLLSGTTPTSVGWYGTEFYAAIGATAWSGQLAANNQGSVYCAAATTSLGWGSVLEIQSPYATQNTKMQYQSVDSFYRLGMAYHASNTQYDGVRFTPTGSTFSGGTVTVYGYRKG